jgi:HlyD family secretion protein
VPLRHRIGGAVLGLAALLLVGLGGARLVLGPATAVERVVQRDFVQTVVASGRVVTPHRVDIGAQITGTVLRVPVQEGQTVTVGTPLVELESTELLAALNQAELAVRQAQARVRQLREVQAPVAEQTLREAQANYEAARLNLERNRDLFTKGYIGRSALEEAERAAQVAQAQLRSAQQQLASAQPAGSDAAAAQAALAQAQAAATAAHARLGYARIVAPVAGTLIARDVEPGYVVQPGKTLMELSPDGETELALQIDEKNLRLLRLGQPALASADAYAQQRFPAELTYINPGVDAQRGSVEVKLRVPDPPDYLMQDMTVSVDIEVARRANAVLVPTDALHDAERPSPWVLRVERGKAQRRQVKLGLCGTGLCEVLDGLRDGDLVVPARTGAVTDGARIRAVAAPAAK